MCSGGIKCDTRSTCINSDIDKHGVGLGISEADHRFFADFIRDFDDGSVRYGVASGCISHDNVNILDHVTAQFALEGDSCAVTAGDDGRGKSIGSQTEGAVPGAEDKPNDHAQGQYIGNRFSEYFSSHRVFLLS